MNLFDEWDGIDKLIEDISETKPCNHSFVTKVIKMGEEYTPEKYNLLNTSDPDNFPHENEPTIAAKDVFCRKCQIRGIDL